MGASDFGTKAKGKTAKDAFRNAVDDAQYQHGHAGYTGTIAEKQEFVVLDVPEGKTPMDFAQDLMDQDDPRINDKWGPAGVCEDF